MSIASRITQIEQHIGNAYDGLDDLGVDLTNVDQNIDNIASKLQDIWNDYPKVTASDFEETMLENTKAGRMELDLKGNTEQDTLTGKNLIDVGSEFVVTSYQRYRDIPCVVEAGSYVFSLEDWKTTGEKTHSIIAVIDSNGNTIINSTISNNIKTRNWTASTDIAKIRLYSQDSYQSSGSGTTTFTKLMFRKSTETDTYEPYCGRNTKPKPRLSTTN